MALYHSAKGSVGYTVVGNPTVVGGVASGFSSSDYLQTTQNFPQSSNPFEMVFKVKFTAVNTTQVLFISNQNLIVAVSGQGHFRLQAQYQNSAWTYSQDGVYSVPVNTDLYIKVLYDGAVFKLSYSTNGISFTDDITISTSTLSFQSGYCLMGTRGNQPLLGYMDLNETYISVNGQPWFGVCPVEVKKHQLMGPVDYTVVGSPTIVDGILSNSNGENYIYTTSQLKLLDTFSFNIRFKRTLNEEVFRFFKFGYNDFTCRISTDGRIQLEYPGSAYTTLGNTSANEWYELELSSNSEVITSTLTNISTQEKTVNSINISASGNVLRTMILGRDWKDDAYTNAGVIDLNNTYIKVNGKLWFYQPAPTKYIQKDDKLVWADQGLYLTGPVNYTVVGNPTIVDGVVTSAGGNNYLTFPQNFDLDNNEVDIIWKGKGSVIRVSSSDYTAAIQVFLSSSNQYILYVNDVVTNVKFYYDASFPYNRLYKNKEGTSYTFYNSADGKEWVSRSTQNFSPAISGSTTNIRFCFTVGSGNSIDLKETYIKVNGDLWFYGKNYATQNIAPVPAGYTFGNTTTPSIGYVDMRTQQFTAAPSGATIGRDE